LEDEDKFTPQKFTNLCLHSLNNSLNLSDPAISSDGHMRFSFLPRLQLEFVLGFGREVTVVAFWDAAYLVLLRLRVVLVSVAV